MQAEPMNRLIQTVRLLLTGKHRSVSYSFFEILAILVILAFFIFMLKL
jgi:hypothetical protein